MDYRAELDHLHSPGSDRASQPTSNLTPPPAALPRAEDPAAHVRTRIELAIRELDHEIEELKATAADLARDLDFAQLQRVQLAKLTELEPAIFAYVIAVLELKLESPHADR